MYPLLYRNLQDPGFQGVPAAVQSELLYLANAVRNQLLAKELARLLHLPGEAGIRGIPLKRITQAQSLYGDGAARVCSNIGILVPAPANSAKGSSSNISSMLFRTAPWSRKKSR